VRHQYWNVMTVTATAGMLTSLISVVTALLSGSDDANWLDTLLVTRAALGDDQQPEWRSCPGCIGRTGAAAAARSRAKSFSARVTR
jgi:hypothetical protein